MERSGLDHLITEKAFQEVIIEAATFHGWWVHHQHDSRHSAAGWPDLVLAREPRLIFAELKREDGKVSAHQAHVLEKLQGCGQEVHVWRPSQLDEILAILGARL